MIAAQESMTAKLCSFARAYHSMLGKNKIFDDYLPYYHLRNASLFCLLYQR